MATSPQLRKVLGALLGVHAGDSLGATFEFMSWSRIKKSHPQGLRDIVGGGPFSWPQGHATDDTDLTRAVLLAYRDQHEHHAAKKRDGKEQEEQNRFDLVKTAAEYSVAWLNNEPTDIGNATYIGLSNYRSSRDYTSCGAGAGSAGNGSLMRCVSTGLFNPSREGRIYESRAISAITHNDVRCTVSCAAYNEVIAALVRDSSVQAAVEQGVQVASELECLSVAGAIERGKVLSIRTIASQGPGPDLPDSTSGFVLQSLSLAIAALMDERSLEDVLVDVVRIGGDTDTNGAIAGGLLGARDGVEAIPERWKEVLQFREEFVEIATRILG